MSWIAAECLSVLVAALPTMWVDLGILVGVIIVVLLLVRRWRRCDDGSGYIRELDYDAVDLHTTKAAREAAYQFKAKYGELRYSNANKILAGEFVRQMWNGTDMRAKDVAMHYPMAVELCLTPLKGAVQAAHYSKFAAVVDRRRAVDCPK